MIFVHSQEDYDLEQYLELFSFLECNSAEFMQFFYHGKILYILWGFGSGDYVSKSEAADVLSDLEGRWVRYDLTGKADEYLGIPHFILGFSKFVAKCIAP